MSYTALVLDHLNRTKLLDALAIGNGMEMAGWEIIAHHMTINMGAPEKGPAAESVGDEFSLRVVTKAEDDKVMAVGVETECPSTNDKTHITIAIHRGNGGKPFLSNKLTNWLPIKPFLIKGTVTEVQ